MRIGAGVAVAVALAASARAARADVVTEADASLGAGATDNVQGAATNATIGPGRTSASFSTATGTLRVRYKGSRAEHALGYRLAYTRYLLIDNPPNTLSHNIAWLSTADLASRWKLSGGANVTITRTSGVDPNDPVAVMPQGALPGSVLYAAGQANQILSWKPDAKSDYEEVLTASHLRYLESTVNGMPANLPTTTALTLALSGERLAGRETYMLELAVSDMFTQVDTVGPVDPTARGHTLLGRLLAGWKHDLSPVWSTQIEAGPSVMLRLDGSGVLAPAAIATLAYNRVPWSAALIATQTPALNPFLGQATISDQVLAHAALPLSKSELFYFGAYGGYVYARVASGTGGLDRAYDQFTGGASLILHLKNVPFAAAATYSVISQRGSNLMNASVPDYARQYVLISVRGDFAWGAGTPPLFGTPL